jgi:CheY-like chemotaxis protein
MNIAMASNTKPLNILLVEDDDGDAKAVLRAFKREKIANPILRAIDGIDAWEMLKGENGKEKPLSPFMLLVDLNMPRMGGLELIKALREDDELRHTIAFVLTTSSRAEDKMAAYDLNVAGYIVKATAGQDFMRLVNLVECYWRIVEMPATGVMMHDDTLPPQEAVRK